jgi:hypothetical protein
MNAESFVQYLQNPSMLYQASYQELKSLALLYPYCPNIHLLLLQKSYLEGRPEWGQNLHKAAAYSIDRRFLYRQMKQMDAKSPEMDSFLLDEEYLELKSLSELETEMAWLERSAPETEPTPSTPRLDAVLPAGGINEDEDDDFQLDFSLDAAPLQPVEAAPASAPEQPASALHSEEGQSRRRRAAISDPAATAELAAAIAAILPVPPPAPPAEPPAAQVAATSAARQFASPQLPILKHPVQRTTARSAADISPRPASSPRPAVAPQPKNTFSSWVEQFQPPHIQDQLSELMEARKKEEAKQRSKRQKMTDQVASASGLPPSAIKSITENEEIATETLAELLCSQGFQDKAIEMYQRLMLVFPEKSSYFAAKIENLKNA